VLAEYTTFWHHPNKVCQDTDKWVADPPEDFDADNKGETPAAGSADPTDGIFGAGLAVVSVVVTVSGNDKVVTTVTTYSDGSTYTKTETTNNDGSITIYQVFRDGTDETVVVNQNGGSAGFIDPSLGSPEEEKATVVSGRQAWRDTTDYDS